MSIYIKSGVRVTKGKTSLYHNVRTILESGTVVQGVQGKSKYASKVENIRNLKVVI